MNMEHFDSDKYRTGSRSTHLRIFHYEEEFVLQSGKSLDGIQIAYESYGNLNEDKSNFVLICHAISGDSHVARHDDHDIPGWWDIMVGPDKPIDTRQYYVICTNVLGGCQGSTGPSTIHLQSGIPYGPDFPDITIEDMVQAQNLLIEGLDIPSILCVIGGSMGGFQAIQWTRQFPEKVQGIIAMATSARLTNQSLAFDIVGRNAITSDPGFQDGNYYGTHNSPEHGLAIARMLAHITYVSQDSMKQKFEENRYNPRDISTKFEKQFSVGSYLAHQGTKFVDRFDANSYLTLSRAIDYFDLGDNKEKLKESLSHTQCDWLLVSFSSDWLYPPFQSEELVDALVSLDTSVSYCSIESAAGHDAFLLPNEVQQYGSLTNSFLKKISGSLKEHVTEKSSPTSTHILFNNRVDLDFIVSLVKEGDRVLDLGCEDGKLLKELKKKRCSRLLGMEIDPQKVIASCRSGVAVIHSDINTGLKRFNDNQFDVAILSQTLQSIRDVEYTIEQILRISRKGIISFPNFAFKPLRDMLFTEGRAPKLKGFYGYNWYNTPNFRFPTILDFQEFCAKKKEFLIKENFFLNSEKKQFVTDQPNLNADTAIFVLGRK